ncbi:MAG: trigger factor [Firmicutes bacterium]|nr:trigger factor [Bacillota bacterium]
MSQLEKLEHNMVRITMEVSPEDFNKAIARVYNKQKNQIAIPGFRKGKAPLKMVERYYGEEVFYEDAVNDVLPDLYTKALDELEVDAVSRPQIELDKITKGEPVVVKATLAVRPEVTLGEYKGLVAEKETIAVTEDDVMDQLKQEADRNSRLVDVTDRAAADGDTVTIDFDGYVDGEAFDGGKSENYKLVLGSHSFVDTFEEQIVGHNIDDAFDVNVTFPENYQEKLAGKAATFKVVLHKIQVKELPVLDDDYAKDYSEFETLEEYKNDIQKKLLDSRQKAADDKRAAELLKKAVENAVMDIPEAMIDEQTDSMIQNFANNLQYQGISMDQYLQMTGSNIAALRANVRPDAETSIKNSLVLDAIVKAEGLEVTDEDVDKEIERLADMYKMEKDKLSATISEAEKDRMKDELKTRKAEELLVAESKEA